MTNGRKRPRYSTNTPSPREVSRQFPEPAEGGETQSEHSSVDYGEQLAALFSEALRERPDADLFQYGESQERQRAWRAQLQQRLEAIPYSATDLEVFLDSFEAPVQWRNGNSDLFNEFMHAAICRLARASAEIPVSLDLTGLPGALTIPLSALQKYHLRLVGYITKHYENDRDYLYLAPEDNRGSLLEVMLTLRDGREYWTNAESGRDV